MKLLSDRQAIFDEVIRLFDGARWVRCVVAFWGQGAEAMFAQTRTKDTRILCNLMSGACNPHEIRALLARKYTLISDVCTQKMWPTSMWPSLASNSCIN